MLQLLKSKIIGIKKNSLVLLILFSVNSFACKDIPSNKCKNCSDEYRKCVFAAVRKDSGRIDDESQFKVDRLSCKLDLSKCVTKNKCDEKIN